MSEDLQSYLSLPSMRSVNEGLQRPDRQLSPKELMETSEYEAQRHRFWWQT